MKVRCQMIPGIAPRSARPFRGDFKFSAELTRKPLDQTEPRRAVLGGAVLETGAVILNHKNATAAFARKADSNRNMIALTAAMLRRNWPPIH